MKKLHSNNIFVDPPDDSMKPPEFTKKLNDLTINDGEQLELAVKVDGDPEPQITWLKNGKVSIIFIRIIQLRYCQ